MLFIFPSLSFSPSILHLLDSPPPQPMLLKPPLLRLRSTHLLHRAASRESSNGISFRGDFSESNDDSNDQLSSVDDSCAKYGGGNVEEDARNTAIKFLAARAITVAKLRKKLTGRKYPCKVIDSVITYLQNRGLVNDELYAESFSRSRWLANTWGPRRIKKVISYLNLALWYMLARHSSRPKVRRAWKWEIPKHCTLRVSCSISKRKFLLNSVGIGAATMIKSPALSESLQETKRSESISGIKKLDSGVKFEDVIAGEGAEAKAGNRVEFNYVCRRSNGYFVFSTVDQFTGESNPVTLLLDENEIIEGLKEVLVGMKVGGKRRALIPPYLGYVNESLKPIPGEFGPRRSLLSHATEPLVFEVQLLKVL